MKYRIWWSTIQNDGCDKFSEPFHYIVNNFDEAVLALKLLAQYDLRKESNVTDNISGLEGSSDGIHWHEWESKEHGWDIWDEINNA